MLKLVKEKIKSIRANQRFRELEGGWHQLQRDVQAQPVKRGSPKRLVVMPSDPWTLVGAKGDEAMIQSVVSQLKTVSQDLEVGVLTSTATASDAAKALGYQALPVWDGGVAAMFKAISEFDADTMAILGADCMDGYYNPMTTLTMLAVADLAARSGIRVSLLGFSFNDKPDLRLQSVFDGLSERVQINVRDEISLARFQKFTKAKSQLVSDSAFKLKPEEGTHVVAATKAWGMLKRSNGQCVLGFNVHPMLLGEPSEDDLQRLIEQVANELSSYLVSSNACLVFISHDYRGAIGDDTCLRPLYQTLVKQFAGRIFYEESRCSAAELKGIAGAMDGVVTGRMHLAIAALGMGVPVAALTYQDKFQGLMKHFDLPQSLLLAPEKLKQVGALSGMLAAFEADLPRLKSQTQTALPNVLSGSEKNVALLLNAA